MMVSKNLGALIKRKLGLLKIFELHGIQIRLEHLSRTLQYYITRGRYEEEERKLCSMYFSKDDMVIEFGSSIGYLSLYCKKIIGVKRIVCVEPNPEAQQKLRANFELNHETPELLSVCLADRDEPITFHSNLDLWESSVLKKESGKNIKTISVRGAQLKTILSEVAFAPTAIIMDIEGGESIVSFNDLSTSVKKIVMELHPGDIGVPNTFKVLNDLMNLGFEVQKRVGNCYALLRS